MLGSVQAPQRAAALNPARSGRYPWHSAIRHLIIFGKLGFLPNIPKNGSISFTRLLQNGRICV